MVLNKYSETLKLFGCEGKGDAYRLLTLYAYNEYFDADVNKIDDVKAGVFPMAGTHVDGVFYNDREAKNYIDILTSYFPSPSGFDEKEIIKYLNSAVEQIKNVKNHIFVSGNDKADQALNDIYEDLKDDEDPSSKATFRIRVITNSDLSEAQAYDLREKLSKLDLSSKNTPVECEIVFGEEIENLIDSNSAPYDFVKEATLKVDKPNNFLSYEDEAIVCNVSAMSLKELWKKEGSRGLLAMNLRYYVKSKEIDGEIADSIKNKSQDFWFFNNGILIVCDSYEFVGDSIKLKNFSIVNGGQTTNRIGNTPFEKDFFLTCKVVKNNFAGTEEKNQFVSDVAKATNSQKPINAKDMIANRVEQRNLKSQLAEANIFIEIKRGEKADKTKYPEVWQKTKNNQLAQDLYSFVYMEPGPARNNVSSILRQEPKYKVLFKNHSYENAFLRDLLFIDKSFEAYKKSIAKDDSIDATFSGLVKNGTYYCFATIGYLAKLLYNPEFLETIRKYKNDDSLFLSYSAEQAFNHRFIIFDNYKDFVKDSFKLYDYIFSNLIKPAFEMAKGVNPELAYSNWTKTNTGFNNIRKFFINKTLYDFGKTDDLEFLKKFFVAPNETTEKKNALLYSNKCALYAAKPKNASGYEMTEEDEELRNSLMKLRLLFSQAKHIPENKIFSDKKLDELVMKKPKTKTELAKIVGDGTTYFVGNEILDTILKHL